MEPHGELRSNYYSQRLHFTIQVIITKYKIQQTGKIRRIEAHDNSSVIRSVKWWYRVLVEWNSCQSYNKENFSKAKL